LFILNEKVEEQQKLVEDQRKLLEERQKFEEERRKKDKEEQCLILGKQGVRPKLSFSLNSK
jgi:hypothetical protein